MRAQSDSVDDEFLAARVLFLMTYDANLDYTQLVRENQLADSINAAIQRHAQRYSTDASKPSQGHTQPMDIMALAETLKLVFNIIHFHQDLNPHFTKSIPNVFKILVQRGITQPPLAAPARELVNALLHLHLESAEGKQATFPAADPKRNAEHLVKILDKAIVAYPDKDLDDTITPVVTLLRSIYEIAPDAVQTAMQKMILPTPEERDEPLGKSDTLPSRLLNLSTSANTATLRGSISSMLFELSHKDPATFVHNVGYGFASGYLMSNNIQMPDDVIKAHAHENANDGIPINPITGQRLDKEEHVHMEPMTQEEKEREAERLFVLFERYVFFLFLSARYQGRVLFSPHIAANAKPRLKATGVVNVQNPVEQAYRSGRIQELPDDSD